MPVYSHITRPKPTLALRARSGFTMIEIMTVMTMVVFMTAMSFPKLKETRRAASMQSARAHVESYLAVSRSIAVRTGGRTYLIRKNNQLRVLADSANTQVTVVRPIDLGEISQVKLSSNGTTQADTIVYDPRGLAVNLSETRKFYITVADGQFGAGVKDSVCVSRFGLAYDRNCGSAVISKP
jgi:Tfp pilus assembly protein FimT